MTTGKGGDYRQFQTISSVPNIASQTLAMRASQKSLRKVCAHLRIPHLEAVGWDLEMCVFHMFPGDADVTGPGTTL